ncbi:BON domain-containing protein [Streptomyces lydicus]|uniref:BON domain-containing protein n=1 Tax=Streptomyces lydicus TaxID=47763 RepID=UPI0036FC56F1
MTYLQCERGRPVLTDCRLRRAPRRGRRTLSRADRPPHVPQGCGAGHLACQAGRPVGVWAGRPCPRRSVAPLFGASAHQVTVSVRDGVVTLRGPLHDRSLMVAATRSVRAVEGVVDVTCEVTGPVPTRTGGETTGPHTGP